MTRYNSEANDAYLLMADEYIPIEQLEGYREGVDRVLKYIASTYAYPKLSAELLWAIKKGLI